MLPTVHNWHHCLSNMYSGKQASSYWPVDLERLFMDRYTLGTAKFYVILLLYRGLSSSEVILYWHGSFVTIEPVLYREVKCIMPLLGPLQEIPVTTYVCMV